MHSCDTGKAMEIFNLMENVCDAAKVEASEKGANDIKVSRKKADNRSK